MVGFSSEWPRIVPPIQQQPDITTTLCFVLPLRTVTLRGRHFPGSPVRSPQAAQCQVIATADIPASEPPQRLPDTHRAVCCSATSCTSAGLFSEQREKSSAYSSSRSECGGFFVEVLVVGRGGRRGGGCKATRWPGNGMMECSRIPSRVYQRRIVCGISLTNRSYIYAQCRACGQDGLQRLKVC